MATQAAENTRVDDPDSRKALAKMLMKLFDYWKLDNNARLNLLGLSSKSRSLLADYRNGDKGLPNNRDTLDRAGYLLAIHKALRLLYPRNPEARYAWIHRRNRALDQHTPLEIMFDRGLIGIATMARYLDHERGR
jgi:hypothetical protein